MDFHDGHEDDPKVVRLFVPPPPEPQGYSPPRAQAPGMPMIDGIHPLDIVVKAAQAHWQAAVAPDGSVNLARAAQAAELAEMALPYTNPKLAAVMVKNVEAEESERDREMQADADRAYRKIEEMVRRRKLAGGDGA